MASKVGSKRGKKTAVESLPSLSEADKALNSLYHKLNNRSKTQDSELPTETAKTQRQASTAQDKTKMSDVISIMEFSSDLNDAEAPPPLPAGEYPASIVKAEIKLSGKGNNYLALMFRIDPESYPADFQDGNPDGETLTYNRVALQDTPQGRYRVRKFMESVGATLGRTVDPNELMGLTATVGVTHGSWEGETRAEIAKVIAA
jgi:hypothetical protein